MLILFFALIILVVLFDLITKYLVVTFLKPVSSVTVIPGLLDFTYVENKGAAFGMMQSMPMRWIFVGVTAAAIIAVIIYMIIKRPKSKLVNISLAFIIGGGIGNLVDRVVNGYVVDFLSLSFFPPVCNVADYFITAGTVMFIIYLIFYSDFLKSDKKDKSQ